MATSRTKARANGFSRRNSRSKRLRHAPSNPKSSSGRNAPNNLKSSGRNALSNLKSSGPNALRSRNRRRSVPSSPGNSNRNRAFIHRHNNRRPHRAPSSLQNSRNVRSSLSRGSSNRNRGHHSSSRPNARSSRKISSGPNARSSLSNSSLSGLNSLSNSSNNRAVSGIINRRWNVRSNRRDHGSNRRVG